MNEKKEIKRESGVRTIRSILIREPDVYFIRSCNTVVQLSKIIGKKMFETQKLLQWAFRCMRSN